MTDKTIRLGFDPHKSDADTAACFRDDIARTLYLLWRPGHLVSDKFAAACLDIAVRIRAAKPTDCESLEHCFCAMVASYDDFAKEDVSKFVQYAFPFIMGRKSVDYKIVIAADPEDQENDDA